MKFINKEGKVFDTIKVADDDYTFQKRNLWWSLTVM